MTRSYVILCSNWAFFGLRTENPLMLDLPHYKDNDNEVIRTHLYLNIERDYLAWGIFKHETFNRQKQVKITIKNICVGHAEKPTQHSYSF